MLSRAERGEGGGLLSRVVRGWGGGVHACLRVMSGWACCGRVGWEGPALYIHDMSLYIYMGPYTAIFDMAAPVILSHSDMATLVYHSLIVT